MAYLTGEEKDVTVSLTFQPGDEIGNYTQITAVFYYYNNATNTPFAYFALVPGTLSNPPGFTIIALTVNGSDLEMTIPATLTESLDFANNSAEITVEISLGTNAAANPTRKIPPISLGKLDESEVGNWLS
jgi:hypothetical protein